MEIKTIPLHQIMSYLNYSGPIQEKQELSFPSVEIAQGCNSEYYLFFNYLKQGFQVNISPFFTGTYFRVRYFNYNDGKYWP